MLAHFGRENNPMVQSAKEMINKYDFKRIEAPDSAYNPSFMNGGSPGIPEVIYQNVFLSKSTLDSVRLESYVEEIDEGCRNTISAQLCDTLNISTAARFKVMFSWRYGMIIDSAPKIAFLSQFDFRNPEDSSEKISVESVAANPNRGVALSRIELERIIEDPKVQQFDIWIKPMVNLRYSKFPGRDQSKNRKYGYLVNGKCIDGINASKLSNEPARKIWHSE